MICGAPKGKHLVEELRERLARIGGLAEEVRGLVVDVAPGILAAIGDTAEGIARRGSIEPARLAQEAALLAERSDISEELDRLRSHLQAVYETSRRRRRARKKTGFSFARDAARSEHPVVQKRPAWKTKRWRSPDWRWRSRRRSRKLREQVQNIE